VKRKCCSSEVGPASELAIVDTFTKLIFGEEDFSSRELSIIQALRIVEGQLGSQCHRDVGIYLRALGVREMIELVGSVRVQLASGLPLQAASSPRPRVANPG
jgi:hypothetical protein